MRNFNSFQLAFVALILAAGCSEQVSLDAQPVDAENGLAEITPLEIDMTRSSWRVESDDQVYEGRLFKYFTLNGEPMIQLINMDAVNVAIAFDGEMAGEKNVTSAMFVMGRGDQCREVGPPESFRIRFEPSEAGWLTGSFSGMLGCPDYRAMPVVGSFHIEAPGDQP
jgi:hypothetical protein